MRLNIRDPLGPQAPNPVQPRVSELARAARGSVLHHTPPDLGAFGAEIRGRVEGVLPRATELTLYITPIRLGYDISWPEFPKYLGQLASFYVLVGPK